MDLSGLLGGSSLDVYVDSFCCSDLIGIQVKRLISLVLIRYSNRINNSITRGACSNYYYYMAIHKVRSQKTKTK